MPDLTAIILTRNEQRHIRECVASVAWMEHVLVFDSGSTDRTREIAAEIGAEVRVNEFQNFAQQRNDALAAANTEWIFLIDADERCTPELKAEIERKLEHPLHFGYWIPRHNYIFGKLTRYTGWYPDYQMRLLKRSEAHYDPNRKVHELVILSSGEAGYLENPLIHYNYDDVRQFHKKQRSYVQYDAQILYEQGVRPKIYTPFLQPVRHFKWRFLDLQGYRDGLHGLRLSLLMAWYEFRKYWILRKLYARSTRQ
jgi:(heptosyl)LPS beta-1,4-glucosyltransferase